MSRSALRERAATAEGLEAVPAPGALARRKELDACWAPVHVVVAAVACWHGMESPAQAVEFVVAGAPGRAEPPVAVGYTTSRSWSGLVKSAMARAETRAEIWMGSEEAPPLLERLKEPRGAGIDSVLQ